MCDRTKFIAILAGATGGAVAVAGMETFSARTAFPLVAIPFATSIVTVLGSPKAEPAQPRALIGGHLVSTFVGLLVVKFFGPAPWAAALAVGLAMVAMHLTGTFHPPAGIDPLVVVVNDMSWDFLLALKEGGKPGRQPDSETLQRIKQRKPPAVSYDDGEWVDPRRAARYLEDKLPKRDRILVFDGGHSLMVTCQTITSPSADSWSLGADFGAVGQGLAIALGACFARPGKRVTHLTADASFIMNVADFHTAVSHNLPLTVFVFNDNAVGQERHDLVHKGLPTKYAEVAQPDFEKLALGFGAKGFRVNRPDDFSEIDKALAVEDGPVIVNVRINGDVELPVSWEIAQHLENTGE